MFHESTSAPTQILSLRSFHVVVHYKLLNHNSEENYVYLLPLVRVQISINKKHDQQMNNDVSPQIKAFGSKSGTLNLSSCNLSGAYTQMNQ